jgi:tetrapyrrole methylase family protein/MazG family protein
VSTGAALDGAGLDRLLGIMARLRAPDGCPWDRAQSLLSLKPWLLEEAVETLEVMDGDPALHCEELGDLLFQIVFQARLREEEGAFAMRDVVASIADKLERRHPHVFGAESIDDPAEVARRWDALKAEEGKTAHPAEVPDTWPALLRAQKVGSRASKLGFDWPDAAGPLAKVDEELAEVRAAMHAPASQRAAALHHEVGDLLFAVVNVARHLGVSAEAALHDASARFVGRVGRVEALLASDGLSAKTAGDAALDAAWERAKHDPSVA